MLLDKKGFLLYNEENIKKYYYMREEMVYEIKNL